MQFSDIKPESCLLEIKWEKTVVNIPFTTNIKDRLRAQIEAALQTDKKPYWQAAQFYNEYDKNLTKALDNVSKGIEGNPKAYWMYLYKAKIQKEMGDNAGAKESATKSLALAKEEKMMTM
jgi:Tfp pilus assembly protein PilF